MNPNMKEKKKPYHIKYIGKFKEDGNRRKGERKSPLCCTKQHPSVGHGTKALVIHQPSIDLVSLTMLMNSIVF